MRELKEMDRVQDALDTALAGLRDDPYLAQKVLAEAKGGPKVKKKISAALVLAIVLILATVTALAVGLTHYFSGFAALENTYGEYEQWPDSARVELVQVMMESGVLSTDYADEWAKAQSQAEKETAAERILQDYFEALTYVDTYNVMTRELGPIEQWSDEERALYISLLEQYGRLTDSWPVYQVPGNGDLSRAQAVQQARDAILSKFSISEEELDALTVDAIFAQEAHNLYGAPADEPFWIVEFGYGYAYRVYMTRAGEMLGIMGPQTEFIRWERGILDGATEAVPGVHDAAREVAVQNARSALTEIMNLSEDEVQALDAAAKFVYSDLYCLGGKEPVWIVSWSQKGQVLWNVLLGYDGSYMDAEPAGKVFDHIRREDTSLYDLWDEYRRELGMDESFFNANGDYYYDWTLEEKASFYEMWSPIAEAYKAEHPYFDGEGSSIWEWTRNVSGLPDEKAITQDAAIEIALKAISEKFGRQLSADDMCVFYYVTHPEKPEWRVANASNYVTIDAYTGEVTLVEKRSEEGPYDTISDFLSN